MKDCYPMDVRYISTPEILGTPPAGSYDKTILSMRLKVIEPIKGMCHTLVAQR